MATPTTSTSPRRVSYTIPSASSSSSPSPLLALPPSGLERNGLTSPIIIKHSGGGGGETKFGSGTGTGTGTGGEKNHPTHCLPILSLALDFSTSFLPPQQHSNSNSHSHSHSSPPTSPSSRHPQPNDHEAETRAGSGGGGFFPPLSSSFSSRHPNFHSQSHPHHHHSPHSSSSDPLSYSKFPHQPPLPHQQYQKHHPPRGLLYTGGRDGLVCSWDLGMKTRRRKRGYGWSSSSGGGDAGDGVIGERAVGLGGRGKGLGVGYERFGKNGRRLGGGGIRQGGGGVGGGREGAIWEDDENEGGGYESSEEDDDDDGLSSSSSSSSSSLFSSEEEDSLLDDSEEEDSEEERIDLNNPPTTRRKRARTNSSRDSRRHTLKPLDSNNPQQVGGDHQTGSKNHLSNRNENKRRIARKKKRRMKMDGIPYEEKWRLDVDRRRGGGEGWWWKEGESPPSTQFRQCVQSHTDWITDLVLCNLNRNVISSSSDRTVKLWSPHDPDPAKTLAPEILGRHKDYVKCLGWSRDQGWVTSGGFDREIKIWDVMEGRREAVVSIPLPSSRSSIYSLAVNPSGSIVAAGSPERIVRVYDPRMPAGQVQGGMGNNGVVAKLEGHSDNIRALLVSEDGKYILSGSSDSSVKLWSVGMQRCIHTFSMHSDSVWSLYSNHPNLETFYSGDRSGIVCKVDLESCHDISEGECVTLFRESPTMSSSSTSHPSIPPSLLGTEQQQGINKLVAQDDVYVWAATGSSSIKRWRDVPRRMSRVKGMAKKAKEEAQEKEKDNTPRRRSEQDEKALRRIDSPSQRKPTLKGQPSIEISPVGSIPPLQNTISPTDPYSPDSMVSGEFPPIGHDSRNLGTVPLETATEIFGIPIDSLVSLAPPEDLYSANGIAGRAGSGGDAADVASLYSIPAAASVVSVHAALRGTQALNGGDNSGGAAIFQPPNLPAGLKAGLSHLNEQELQIALLARQDFWERQAASDAIPLRSFNPERGSPGDEEILDVDDVIEGSRGLVRAELLNDRRHAVSVDTEGRVELWDLVMGCCVGRWDEGEVDEALGLGPTTIVGSNNRRALVSSIPNNQTLANNLASIDGNYSYTKEALELVKGRIEGEGITIPFCTIDTGTGRLTVHLEETRCFDAELYADEAGLEKLLPFSSTSTAPSTPSTPGPVAGFDFKEDHRLVLGKWILRNLFRGFIEEEILFRLGGMAAVKGAKSDTKAPESPSSKSRHSSRSPSHSPSHSMSPSQPQNGAATTATQAAHVSLTDLRSKDYKPPPSSFRQPSTPGMTIGLATPAPTPALPLDPKDIPQTPRAGSSTKLPTIPGSPPTKNGGEALMKIPTPLIGPQQQNDKDKNADYFSYPKAPGSRGGRSTPGSVAALADPDATPMAVSTAINAPAIKSSTEPPTPSSSAAPSLSIMGRLRSFGGRSKRVQPSEVSTGGEGPSTNSVVMPDSNGLAPAAELEPTTTTTPSKSSSSPSSSDPVMSEEEARQLKDLQSVLSKPIMPLTNTDAPPIPYPDNIAITISEANKTAEGGGGWNVIYRGLTSTTARDADVLEMTSPSWLLEVLLGGRHPTRDPLKISFVLSPWDGGTKSSQGPGPLPPLPSGNVRLTANRILRVRKIAAYVCDKLELLPKPTRSSSRPASVASGVNLNLGPNRNSTDLIPLTQRASPGGGPESPLLKKMQASSSSSSVSSLGKRAAEDVVELLCNGKVLPPKMTLGGVKQYVFRQVGGGGDVALQYRLKH